MNNYDAKKKIGNPLFVLFLIYTLIIVNTEWINFIFEIMGYTLRFGIAEIVSIVIVLGFCIITRNRWVIEHLKFNVEIIIGIIAIMVLGIVISVHPDQSFDTYNYHLIAQNPHFENYFVEDYGYGHFQVWGFRLSDRLFYYFRYALGFRLGTILNILILIVSFTQLYKILDFIFKKYEIEKRGLLHRIACNRLLWTLVILFPLDAIFMFGTYYVDVVAFPVALEVLYQLTMTNKQQKTGDIAYFALLNGLWVGFKLTNIVYAVPCVLIYVILHFKEIKIKEWLVAVASGIYPFAVYLIFNYLCTGNPIFPYFNKIFKSPYFSLSDFKDGRWGGTTTFEKLFWVIYAAFKPEYRQSEMYDYRPATLIIGLLGTVVLVVGFIYRCRSNKKQNRMLKEYLIILIIALASSFLWAFTTGYSRYFLFGKLLWGILAFWFLAYIIKYYEKTGIVISLICSLCAIVSVGLNIESSSKGRNWNCSVFSIETFKEQIQYLLSDKDITTNYDVDIDMFVLNDHTTMGVAELIDDEIYMFNTNYTFSDKFDYQSLYEEKLEESEDVYDIHKRNSADISEYIVKLNNNSLYAEAFDSIEVGAGDYELVKVGKLEDNLNTVWISDEEILEIDVSDFYGEYMLSFISGRYYDWEASNQVTLKIYTLHDNDEQEVGTILVDNVDIMNCEIPIIIDEEDKCVYIRAYYSSGEIVPINEINKVFVLNATIY